MDVVEKGLEQLDKLLDLDLEETGILVFPHEPADEDGPLRDELQSDLFQQSLYQLCMSTRCYEDKCLSTKSLAENQTDQLLTLHAAEEIQPCHGLRETLYAASTSCARLC